ncbi:DUF4179 domain-containing protein [Aquibacillus koreensis]|uniref:DUF4179 domain-containing protein n=1 Tax=Aquibacillus koreensis TaxID=279446 RepID=A0A9X3WM19_9BACI|nr:DUF4179 domain-containing protein [Aquibacillus koreensis]MCT2534941.1 DUF4179 domain-containing protein [Aquibacillus koreensis]MDC3422165.1 DUF4179 domain-containing protein [Aquibacillus koreensis]
MSDIEKKLQAEKDRLNQTTAPPELEHRLRTVLEDKKRTRKKKPLLWKTLIAAILLFGLISYNYNGLAYYGKKILGFDEVNSETLNQLNEAGYGQIIDKELELSNGTILTLNGVISDENRMIVYYTLSNPNGNIAEAYNDLWASKITGFLTSSQFESGSAEINESETELKGMMDFEAPSPFAKKLTMHFDEKTANGQYVEKEISFAFDPNQALRTSIKQPINQSMQVDGGTITFKSIIASPTMTVIKGSMNVDHLDRVRSPFSETYLFANGTPIADLGSGISTNITGTKFELEFDALPSHLDSLELHVDKFVGYHKLDKAVMFTPEEEVEADIGSKKLTIKHLKHTDRGSELTIVTDEDVMLDEVSMGNESRRVELITTIGQTYEEADGEMRKKRTLLFDETKEADRLYIGGMHYMKAYNETINIPIK